MARKTRAQRMPGAPTKLGGPSIKNPRTYEALRREGMSKSRAAAISNGVLNSGAAKGRKSPRRKG